LIIRRLIRFYSDESPLLKERRVLADEALPLGRHVRIQENRRHRTGGLAGGAVGAGRGVYVHLVFMRAPLNAVNRANVNARQLFRAGARLTNYVGQN